MSKVFVTAIFINVYGRAKGRMTRCALNMNHRSLIIFILARAKDIDRVFRMPARDGQLPEAQVLCYIVTQPSALPELSKFLLRLSLSVLSHPYSVPFYSTQPEPHDRDP